MSRSLPFGALCLAVAALTASACDKSTDLQPVNPGPVQISEPDFTGNLSINGAVVYNFSNVFPGIINATVKTIDPNTETNSRSIGVDVGVWSGIQCQTVVANPNAGVGSGVA